MTSVVQCGLLSDHSFFYGDALVLNETDRNGTLSFDAEVRSDWFIEDESDGIIAIQLGTCTKGDLIRKGNRVAKRWSP